MIVYFVTIVMLAALAMAGSILYVSHKEDERERELEQKRQSTPKNYHHGETDDELVDGIKSERLRCARAAADVFKEHASRMQRLGEERGVYLYFSIAEFYDDLLERLNK